LLLGGVLKGQELIANAKVKSAQQEVQAFSAAIYSYVDKTGYLPGDNPNETNNAGDGDGTIDNGERQPLFQHLKDQGLISGDYDGSTYAKHAWGGDIIIDEDTQISGLTAMYNNLPRDVAEQLDLKMDDGDSATGDVQINGGAANYSDTDTQNDVLIKVY
ncbi:MAG: hypothetical protein CO000_06235, partial [Piscirickettsiaceae bacterium CG_4_8_14_3_um_filter_44_38]